MRIKWRNLELPNRVVSERGTLSDTHGRFVAEPFEQGLGTTIANSLRRVLLSSLEGSAVTKVKIQGVQHEISSIPGIEQDVTDIILNIKSLVVKNLADTPRVIRIEKREAGEIRAADIIHDADIQIFNPEHFIAKKNDNVPFIMEMTVENGRGYRTAEEIAGKDREHGVIPVDANFSPVTRVKYEITEARVGQRTNYDRVVIEIWTNGTTTPQMALVEAAKILRKHLNPFIQYTEPGEELPITDSLEVPGAQKSAEEENLRRKLAMSLAELDLSVRATNCLESEGINTVEQLVVKTEDDLLEVRNFGETTLKEVKQKLQEQGLSLGMRIPRLTPPKPAS
ncbi:MAG: DNA-directed RNA polymerase subunit alpha [Gemmataceae bacterium]|jgi:DNA-directed RNA polymerase subunit alpha|nr:DNA-directed RNA polymerase subunit alpha [Gemmataceae bacterium]